MALIFWSIVFMTVGASTFFNAFLFYEGQFACPPEVTGNCKEYVCSLPAPMRTNYIDDDFESLASKFGDYRCENSQELDTIQSFVYVGGIVGVIAGAFINEYVSKKKLMILTVVANILGIGLTIVGPTLMASAAGLFVNYAAKCIQTEIVTCYVTESISEGRRGKDIMVIYLFYALGVTLNGLVFDLFASWQWALLFYQVVPFFVVLFALLFFIEETPFDQVVNYAPEQSLAAFQRIAVRNDRQDEHGITVEEIANIKEEYL